MRIPDRETATLFFRHYVLMSIVFCVIYGGTNYLTSLRPDRHRFYAEWELAIPFVPEFIYVYLTVFVVFLLPVLSLDRRQIRGLSQAFLLATVTAGIVFLLLPAEMATARPATVPGHDWVFALFYRFELPHNLFPSLHVTYGSLFLFVVFENERAATIRFCLVVWWLLLLSSVVLVRQHHIADVVGGLVLATICYLAVYRRLT